MLPFLLFPSKLLTMYWRRRSCACYKVCGVDKLTDNWNLYRKEFTHPKLTLYVPRVENMVSYMSWWLAKILMSKFLLKTFFQLKDIQYSSKYRTIGVLGEEGLKLVWRCCASARPKLQSSVAVYNHTRWSRTTTCFFWVVYFHDGQ